jgi:hypothetical protein
VAFVEVRLVAEAERRVPRLELLRALEEADDIAVLGIRGHPIPGFWREDWRIGFDDRMEPLAHGAIRLRQRGDLREHGAFPVRSVRALAARVRLQLLEVLPHGGSFLVRESLGLLSDRGGALGGFLRGILCRFHSVFISTRATRGLYSAIFAKSITNSQTCARGAVCFARLRRHLLRLYHAGHQRQDQRARAFALSPVAGRRRPRSAPAATPRAG